MVALTSHLRSNDDQILDGVLKRETPKINGSSGGFIALVVSLGFIIMMSCGAIYYLLRNHEPTDDERAARKQRQYEQATVSGPKSWPFHIRQFLSSGSKPRSRSSPSTGTTTGGAQGWMPAATGDDEWDYRDDSTKHVSPSTVAISAAPVSILASAPRPIPTPSASTSTVTSGPGLRFSTPPESLSRATSAEQTVALFPIMRSASPEPISLNDDSAPEQIRPKEGRNDSTQSTTSLARFTGGTKFIEGL